MHVILCVCNMVLLYTDYNSLSVEHLSVSLCHKQLRNLNRLWAQSQMASEVKSVVSVVALNGDNYPTWKVQCKMALIREGLWEIVAETEDRPDGTDAAKLTKYLGRRD